MVLSHVWQDLYNKTCQKKKKKTLESIFLLILQITQEAAQVELQPLFLGGLKDLNLLRKQIGRHWLLG